MIVISGIGTLPGSIIGAATLMIGTELPTPLQEEFTALSMSMAPVFGVINVFIAVCLILP